MQYFKTFQKMILTSGTQIWLDLSE